MFKNETYINRRKLLKEQLKSGIALFFGHDESPINFADNCYQFRQDSSFLYFFGHNLPNLIGVIDLDEGIDYLFGNNFEIDDLIWRGYQPSIESLAQRVGVNKSANLKEFEQFLQKSLLSKRKICLLPPYRASTKLKIIHYLGLDFLKKLELSLPTESVDFIKAVVSQRQIKTDEEIAQIEEAVDITVDIHIEAIKSAKAGMTEHQVVLLAYKKMLDIEDISMSFTPIATTRGEILHNHFYGNTIKKGDLFLLDGGVENKMHYSADLSTTFPVNAKFTALQKDIYQITLDAHQAAIAMLAPDVPFKDVHIRASKTIAEGLKSIGVMKGDVDEAVELGAHALFFPCGTGHMMGLDVHDMEDLGEIYVGYDGEAKSEQFGLKSLRLAKPLKAGFVLTIEPGIYFIPALIDKWNAEKKFVDFINYNKLEPSTGEIYRTFGGIRNEENYLITQNGARALGKPKPKTIDEIESLALLNRTKCV
ncbi:MAG: aminopeptidase P N-terminal domain-containing protein [Desulfamplus sp.]|nr:aminopeptidase P N-terminal domain-containing protein [Desulfamplus sp.]